MTTRLLLRGGTVIDPERALDARADVLIENKRIASVGAELPHPPDTEIIDATDRLVLPGFVDTHRHTWQAGIRAIAPDVEFAGYLSRILGELAPRYSPEDVHAGTLAGALECLEGGITTLVDWSHIQRTPAHTAAAVEALDRSGIRALFGYCYGGGGGPSELLAEGHRVHREHFTSPGELLSMIVAPWGPEIVPGEVAMAEWRLARELDLPVSVHMGGHGPQSAARGLEFLSGNALVTENTTFIHANHYTDEQLKLISDAGGSISVSPFIEIELGIGLPVTGRARSAGLATGLGADTVTSGPGDMFSLMRSAYMMERSRPGSSFSTRDALRMATIEGARVVGLDPLIGSLTPGKQADVILLRTDSLGMGAAHDPIGATVLSADTGTVDTVIVAGRVVKRDGRLLHHDLKPILDDLRTSAARLTGR
jgi:cytosine/adenosine deaminase-related metal-dependent hydrolase